VLCYHAVSNSWSDELAVPPRLLEAQLTSLLRRGYQPVAAGDVLAGHARSLHVTFDDAYTSVEEGLAVLQRLGIPATVFACTGYAENGRPLDVPELAGEALAHPEEMATMSWDELRDLANRGVEIGSHTSTHPHLRRLSDMELDHELSDSRLRLEEELGRSCRFLAYPYGENDARVREAARRAGYEAAFALREPFAAYDPFALPRVDLYRKDTPLRAWLKTSLLPRIPPWTTQLAPRRRRDTRRLEADPARSEPDPQHPRQGKAPAADDL
jgi:peptidoglycan/xylan/chitin deacetylase (PgdA/CDA1 family)